MRPNDEPNTIGGSASGFASRIANRVSSLNRDLGYADGDYTGPYVGSSQPELVQGQSQALAARGNARAGFVNGINNSIRDHQNLGGMLGTELAATASSPVIGVYNRSGSSVAQKVMHLGDYEAPPLNEAQPWYEQLAGLVATGVGMVTDIAQWLEDDAREVDQNPATQTVVSAMRSGSPRRWVGHSQGSMIVVSALTALHRQHQDISRFTIDLIGSQAASAPPGPNYLRMIGTDDNTARAPHYLFAIRNLLVNLTHLRATYVREGDVNLEDRTVWVDGLGHPADGYVPGLEEGRSMVDPEHTPETPLNHDIPLHFGTGVLEDVSTWLNEVGEAVRTGSVVLIRAAVARCARIRSIVMSLPAMALRGAMALGRGAVRMARQLGATVADLARDIGRGLRDGIGWIQRRVTRGITVSLEVMMEVGRRLYGLGANIAERGWQFLSFLRSNAGEIGFRAMSMLLGAAGYVRNGAEWVLGTALNAAHRALALARSTIDPVINFASDMFQSLSSFAQPVVDILSQIGQRIMGVASRIATLVGSFLGNLISSIPGVGQAVMNRIRQIADFIRNPVAPIMATINNLIELIQRRLTNVVNNISSRVERELNEIQGIAHRILALIDSIPGAVESAIASLNNVVAGLEAMANSAVERVMNVVPSLLQPAARAILSFGGGIWSSIIARGRTIANNILNRVRRGQALAHRIVEGLDIGIEAIRTLERSVAQLALRVIQNPIQAARDFGTWVMGGRAPDMDLSVYDRGGHSAADARRLYAGPGRRAVPADGALFGPFFPDRWAGARGTINEALGSRAASVYVNGQATTPETLFDTCEALANELGRPVVGLYNRSGVAMGRQVSDVDTQSTSAGVDTVESTTGKIGMFGLGLRTPAIVTLINILRQYGTDLDLHGHSQGTIIISEALRHLQREGASLEHTAVNFYGTAVTTVPEGLQRENIRVFAYDSDTVAWAVGPRGAVMPWRIFNSLAPMMGMRTISDQLVTLHHTGSGIRPHGMIADPVPLLDDNGQPIDGQYERYPDGRIIREDMVWLRDARGRIRRDVQGQPMQGSGPRESQFNSYVSDRQRFLARDARQRLETPDQRRVRIDAENTIDTLATINAWASDRPGDNWLGEFLEWYRARQAATGPNLAEPPAWLRNQFPSGATVQRSGDGDTPDDSDPERVRTAVVDSDGGGSPLDSELMLRMGRHFGADFSDVRVHWGPAAADQARSLRAQAFAIGSDIFFGEGRYEPNSAAGRALIAHELTHVVQQSGGTSLIAPFRPGATTAMEREAEQRSELILAEETASGPDLEVQAISLDTPKTERLPISDEDLGVAAAAAYQIARQKLAGKLVDFELDSFVLDVSLVPGVTNPEEIGRMWAEELVAKLTQLHGTPGGRSAARRSGDSPSLKGLQRQIDNDPPNYTLDNGRAGRVQVENIVGKSLGPGANAPSINPAWWQPLYDQGHTKSNPFAHKSGYGAVKMHLWNGRLNGPGHQEWNLAPGPATTNSSMSAGPETDSKSAVDKGFSIWLDTRVTYATSPMSLLDITSYVPNYMQMDWGYMLDASNARVKGGRGVAKGPAESPQWAEAVPPPPGAMPALQQAAFRTVATQHDLTMMLLPLSSPLRMQAFPLVPPQFQKHMVLTYPEIFDGMDDVERGTVVPGMTAAELNNLRALQGYDVQTYYYEAVRFLPSGPILEQVFGSLDAQEQKDMLIEGGFTLTSRNVPFFGAVAKTDREVWRAAVNPGQQFQLLDGMSPDEIDVVMVARANSPSIANLDLWARVRAPGNAEVKFAFLQTKLNAGLLEAMRNYYLYELNALQAEANRSADRPKKRVAAQDADAKRRKQ